MLKKILIPFLNNLLGQICFLERNDVEILLMESIKKYSLSKTPEESLKFLLSLNNELYAFTGQESVRYGDGMHTKHRHIKYHDFFIKHIVNNKGKTILDIGCGKGLLAYDVTSHVTDVEVTGIDMNEANIAFAKTNYAHPKLNFYLGNALTDLPGKAFDSVILSNVLEHIENRIEFLKGIKKNISPKHLLLRVPLYERDWRVPLMEELGIDYRLDKTHFVEYIYEDFEYEVRQAGFSIIEKEFRWGEVWCVAKPD